MVSLVLLAAACKQPEAPAAVRGDPSRGKVLVEQLTCPACHVIPGIEGARGMIGPSLEEISDELGEQASIERLPRSKASAFAASTSSGV